MWGPTEEEERTFKRFVLFVLVLMIVGAFLAGRYLPLPTIELHW